MNQSKHKILLVDDDVQLCQLLSEFLNGAGFETDYILDGQEAIDCIQGDHQYDAMVLDIMMPVVSGFDVLKAVRANHDIPIIMLTGRGDDIDRILGLEMGADDYLGKPCNPRELSARLNAVLRRSQKLEATTESAATPVTYDGLTLNTATLEVLVFGERAEFTHAEFRVLQLLLQHIGQTLTKEHLTEEVLQRKLTSYDRSIDVHISRVRQKLLQYSDLNISIKSIRGIGYQMIAS